MNKLLITLLFLIPINASAQESSKVVRFNPPGEIWYCGVSEDQFDLCTRNQDTCESFDADAECYEQERASCVSFYIKVDGGYSVICTSTVKDCLLYKELLEEDADYSEVSYCSILGPSEERCIENMTQKTMMVCEGRIPYKQALSYYNEVKKDIKFHRTRTKLSTDQHSLKTMTVIEQELNSCWQQKYAKKKK